MAHSPPDSGWIYHCDDIVVEPRAHRLERAGTELSVEPKAYAVLVVLLQQAGEVVGKDALLDAAWGHRHVTPGVLTRVISQLRHTLGDHADRPRYIATVHSLGYRFIGDVRRTTATLTPSAPPENLASGPGTNGHAGPPVHAPSADPPRPGKTPATQWLAAAITLAVIVLMLAIAGLWHPPIERPPQPHSSPQPALIALPLAHNMSPHALQPRHWPRTRRIATTYPADHGGAGYLPLRPEQAPAARE